MGNAVPRTLFECLKAGTSVDRTRLFVSMRNAIQSNFSFAAGIGPSARRAAAGGNANKHNRLDGNSTGLIAHKYNAVTAKAEGSAQSLSQSGTAGSDGIEPVDWQLG